MILFDVRCCRLQAYFCRWPVASRQHAFFFAHGAALFCSMAQRSYLWPYCLAAAAFASFWLERRTTLPVSHAATVVIDLFLDALTDAQHARTSPLRLLRNYTRHARTHLFYETSCVNQSMRSPARVYTRHAARSHHGDSCSSLVCRPRCAMCAASCSWRMRRRRRSGRGMRRAAASCASACQTVTVARRHVKQ